MSWLEKKKKTLETLKKMCDTADRLRIRLIKEIEIYENGGMFSAYKINPWLIKLKEQWKKIKELIP